MFKKTIEATLHNVQAVSIHGQRYYDIVYSENEKPDIMNRSRAPFEEVYRNPQPGDTVLIHMIMDTITRIDLAE